MEYIIPHDYLIHPTGIVLYLESIHEHSAYRELTYKVVYITEEGLSCLSWRDFHSNNLNLDNHKLLNQTFVLKIKIPKYHLPILSRKSVSFSIFFRKCTKIKSDKLDLIFKPKERCGLPYGWKKNENTKIT